MARQTPIRKRLEALDASLVPYGPDGETPVDLVEACDEVPVEYAAIRKACLLLDEPHRGTLEITGSERLEFLNRMLTQELKGLEPFTAKRSFWLNRKGRIDADMRLVELGERTLVDLDVHAAARARETLDAYVFAEDIEIRDATDEVHRLALHGPQARALLASVGEHAGGAPIDAIEPGQVALVRIGGAETVVDRQDATGEMGLELLVKAGETESVADALLEAGARLGGWHAWNIARIEGGWPLYYLDFGPDSLPQESGVFEDRVSTTKGCYLGQEVVARLHSLGTPKQLLVGLRLDPSSDDLTMQPVTGDAVAATDDADAKPVGAVTSATLSPMLGDAPVCFAQVRTKHAEPGNELFVRTGRGVMRAKVQEGLAFWRPRVPA